MDMGGHHNTSVALASGKRLCTRFRRGLVGPRAHMDVCEKSRPPLGFDPRTFQTVAIRYTDWAILAQISK
jgi:hypothetical protein